MNTVSHDPRDIPILTDAVEKDGRPGAEFDATAVRATAVRAAVVAETLELAGSLLLEATNDIEAVLFERVFDQLRARLPELVEGVLREHAVAKPLTHG